MSGLDEAGEAAAWARACESDAVDLARSGRWRHAAEERQYATMAWVDALESLLVWLREASR